MGKLSIFKPVADIPLGMHEIDREGVHVFMPRDDCFVLFTTSQNKEAGCTVQEGVRSRDTFEFTVKGKTYRVVNGVLDV